MRTSEIVDLAHERRLSAVLDFTSNGAELLILNGGSRAEELVVVTAIDAVVRAESRSAYCIDSGTSLQLLIPLARAQRADDLTVRIIGGHGEMVLSAARRSRAMPVLRSPRTWATLGFATALLLLAGGRLDSPGLVASADPEPAAVEAPLIAASVSLHVPAHLPNVDVRAIAVSKRRAPSIVRPIHVAERRAPIVAVAPVEPPTRRADPPETPEPRMTDLRVPTTAKSGDFIPVSFGAVARQVKIVASIGPTIVSKTIIGAQHGVIAIRSPKSDLDSRVMTVRAYAQNGNRTSTLQAMVVLVHP